LVLQEQLEEAASEAFRVAEKLAEKRPQRSGAMACGDQRREALE
jgi:hypothetical protein